MNNNRSGRRGQHHRHRRPLQIDEEVWTIKPLTDHHHLSPPSSPPATATATATAPAPTIVSVPIIGTRQKRVAKNRRAHRPKPMSVNKSEVGSLNSLDSQLGSLSIAEKVIEKEEDKEEEEEEDRTEVSESSDQGVDGVLSRWEELQLGVQEPELSEQQLRINDQLQEDEVNYYLISMI